MDEDDFELNNLLNQIDSENNLISLQTLIFLTRNNRVNNRIRRNQIRFSVNITSKSSLPELSASSSRVD